MTDTLTTAIVAGAFAIGGGLLSQMGAYFNQRQQREREREADTRAIRRAKHEHLYATYTTLITGAWAMHTAINDTREKRLLGQSWEEIGPFGLGTIYNSSFTREAFQAAQVEASLVEEAAAVLASFTSLRQTYLQFVDEFQQRGDMTTERMAVYKDAIYGEVHRLIALAQQSLSDYPLLPAKRHKAKM